MKGHNHIVSFNNLLFLIIGLGCPDGWTVNNDSGKFKVLIPISSEKH